MKLPQGDLFFGDNLVKLAAVVRNAAFEFAAPCVRAHIGGIVAHVNQLCFRVSHLTLQQALVAFQHRNTRLQARQFRLPPQFAVAATRAFGLFHLAFLDSTPQPFGVCAFQRGLILLRGLLFCIRVRCRRGQRSSYRAWQVRTTALLKGACPSDRNRDRFAWSVLDAATGHSVLRAVLA